MKHGIIANFNGITIENDLTTHGIYIQQVGVLAASNYAAFVYSNAVQINSPLTYIHQDNAASSVNMVELVNDGTGNALLINQTNTGGAHIQFTGDPANASPNDGEMWFTGSALNFRNGAATVDLLASGGGNRTATLVIAAVDSLDTSGADYVCDGTADEVQVQAAVDALAAGGVEGRIIMLEGNYVFAAEVLLNANDSGIIIQGQGWGTRITYAQNMNDEIFNFNAAESITLRDLMIQSTVTETAPKNKILFDGSSSDCRLIGVKIDINTIGAALALMLLKVCDRIVVERCEFRCIEGESGWMMVSMAGANHCTFINNYFDGTAVTVNVTACLQMSGVACANNSFIGNSFQGDSADCDYGIVISNTNGMDRNAFTSNQIWNMGTGAIHLVGANIDRPLIVGNVIPDGITDGGATNTVIANNITS